MEDLHPVDPAIGARIQETLSDVEHRERVRILFACESGSRGWGFSSPDSDYDVRFLYVHDLDFYLTIRPGRDVIELPVDAIYDVNGWDLRKSLGLLAQGNATLIEWLSSPIIYRQDAEFLTGMKQVIQQVWQPQRSFYHYRSIGQNQRKMRQVDGGWSYKRVLYALRGLLAASWVVERGTPPPMAFEELVAALVDEAPVRTAIDALLVVKRGLGEKQAAAPVPILEDYLDRLSLRLDAITLPTTAPTWPVLDAFLSKTVLATMKSPLRAEPVSGQ